MADGSTLRPALGKSMRPGGWEQGQPPKRRRDRCRFERRAGVGGEKSHNVQGHGRKLYFLVCDRPDSQYAAREGSRWMPRPRRGDHEMIVRIGKCALTVAFRRVEEICSLGKDDSVTCAYLRLGLGGLPSNPQVNKRRGIVYMRVRDRALVVSAEGYRILIGRGRVRHFGAERSEGLKVLGAICWRGHSHPRLCGRSFHQWPWLLCLPWKGTAHTDSLTLATRPHRASRVRARQERW